MNELRVEVGVKESFKTKLARSRVPWAGHVDRMGDDYLAKRADARKVDWNRRRGRPKLQWRIALRDTLK